MSDKKSAKKKDSKDKKPAKESSKKKDTKKKDTKKKDSKKKDAEKSATPKSSKESTSTSSVKAPKDSKKSKDSKGKSSKGKGSKGKGSKKKDSSKKTSKKTSIQLAQVRELLDDTGSAGSEHRVLVDRLWPRGIKKERLAHDEWDKDVAPSPDLRKAFHSGDLDFDAFRGHYLQELSDSDAPRQLLDTAAKAKAKTIILVYGAKDAEHNHAQVLADHLRTMSTS